MAVVGRPRPGARTGQDSASIASAAFMVGAAGLAAAGFLAFVAFFAFAAFFAGAFLAAAFFFVARFDGPAAARARSNAIASDNVRSSGLVPRGTVAFVVPSVQYAPKRLS